MDYTSIKQMIQSLGKEGTPKIVTGKVTEDDPIEITLVNDLNIVLHAASLTVPSRIGTLAVGDEVYMLSTNNNKAYYVLDKV